MNFYAFHIGDYAAHTAHLEPMEDLAYRRCLDLYYTREAALPADPAEVARLARLRGELAAVETVLKEFFELTEAGWTHKRCDVEIAEAQEKRAKAQASANKRWGGNANAMPTHSERIPDAVPSVCEPNAPNPNPNPTPKQKKAAPAGAGGYPQEFEEAWTAYPPRSGKSKPDAFKAWNARIKDGADPQAVLAGVKRYAAYVQANATEDKYIKQPTTFFGPGLHFQSEWAVPGVTTPTPKQTDDAARYLNDDRTPDEIKAAALGGIKLLASRGLRTKEAA